MTDGGRLASGLQSRGMLGVDGNEFNATGSVLPLHCLYDQLMTTVSILDIPLGLSGLRQYNVEEIQDGFEHKTQ